MIPNSRQVWVTHFRYFHHVIEELQIICRSTGSLSTSQKVGSLPDSDEDGHLVPKVVSMMNSSENSSILNRYIESTINLASCIAPFLLGLNPHQGLLFQGKLQSVH